MTLKPAMLLAPFDKQGYSRAAMRSLILALALLCGCAFTRKETHTLPMAAAAVSLKSRPANMWTIQVLSGDLPPRKPSGLPWDDDKSGPDPFVRLMMDGRKIWESPVATNSAHPTWNVVLPANVVVPANVTMRFEVWDFDSTVAADPMGATSSRGLPGNALPNAEARLTLDNLANLTIKVTDPTPKQGVGLTVEIHPDALHVVAVVPYSPASRAGIRVGDRIVGIGGATISELSDNDAFSRLTLAIDSVASLTVASPHGEERTVTLDKDPLWSTL